MIHSFSWIFKFCVECLLCSHCQICVSDLQHFLCFYSNNFLFFQYLAEHLVFLQFILQDGAQYLPWSRAKDIWETLISNPEACDKDKEVTCLCSVSCFKNLKNCLILKNFACNFLIMFYFGTNVFTTKSQKHVFLKKIILL